MSEFTIAGLRVIFEVARTGSFSAAAEALGYTQSAISRQVAATERVAATPLFERQARGVRTTAAGDAVVRYAGTVLETIAAANQELSGMRDRLAGRLAVGGFPTASAVLLPRALARMANEHPALTVQLVEVSTPQQLAALRRGRLEVAVIATGEGLPAHDLDGLSLVELRSDRGAGVAVAATHPFAARESVDSTELAEQRWIVGRTTADSPEFGPWPGIDDPQIAFSARDWTTRLGLVAAGHGIALVPGLAAAAVPDGVRWIPVRGHGGGLHRQVWAATAAEPSPAARALVRALESEAATITSA